MLQAPRPRLPRSLRSSSARNRRVAQRSRGPLQLSQVAKSGASNCPLVLFGIRKIMRGPLRSVRSDACPEGPVLACGPSALSECCATKRTSSPNRELFERAVHDAVAMEIDLAAIGAQNEAA